jgi:uncharacterized protein YjbI with pentapeptide repeats
MAGARPSGAAGGHAPVVHAADSPTGALRRRLSTVHYGQSLRGVDFSDADLSSVATAGFLGLDRCSFRGADLRHATLDGCSFKLCDLSGANLRNASLRGVWFSGCDLTGADLRDADLYEIHLAAVGVGRGAIPTRLKGALLTSGALVVGEEDPGAVRWD